jgi:hypothetical protein
MITGGLAEREALERVPKIETLDHHIELDYGKKTKLVSMCRENHPGKKKC